MSDDPHLLDHPLGHCPGCGSPILEPVVEVGGDDVRFLCGECDRCWRVELGFVQRVDPGTCAGCPARSRCTAAYAADHPT